MNESVLWHTLLAILIADFGRYALAAGGVFLLLWKLLRRRVEHRRINPEYPRVSDLWREFSYSLSTVVLFAATGFLIFLLADHGTFIIYADVHAFGWAYTIFSLPLLIVLHDLYFYWTHRAMHQPAIFRRVHAVHHRSRNPSPWAAYSFHPFEAIIQAAFLPLALCVLPLHAGVIALFLLHMILRNVLGHSGVEIYPRDAVRHPLWRWLTSTTHHHLHHETLRGNYGLYFSWWDRWLGTQHPEYFRVFDAVTHRSHRN